MASISVVKNIALDDTATANSTGTVHEPTAASVDDEVFVTGNWSTSHSSDGGANWTFINPFDEPFPAGPPGAAGAFCCDQVVVHERSRDLWILVLQYTIGPGGTNIFRIAVTTGTPGPPWTSFAFEPDPGLGTNNVEFDFPHVATSDNHLYISYNVFSNGNFAGANVFQIELDALAALDLSGPTAVFVFTTGANELGSLCLTRGATTDMYFASHDGTGNKPLTVFKWPDVSGAAITSFDVSPSAWQGSFQAGAYTAPGPGGEWLTRLDSRVLAGWIVGDQAGFLWSALPGPGRPQPFLKGMVVDVNTEAVVFEPDIFSPDIAFTYPSAFPNANGKVGLSLFFGGGTFDPSHAVTWLDGQQWVSPFTLTRSSTDAPVDSAWGDYCSCATHDAGATNWVAAGYTLQGGNDVGSIEPQYVEFAEGP